MWAGKVYRHILGGYAAYQSSNLTNTRLTSVKNSSGQGKLGWGRGGIGRPTEVTVTDQGQNQGKLPPGKWWRRRAEVERVETIF